MSWYNTVATGMLSLLGHRMRSALTMLGILFGVAAVICTVGIGEASSASVSARISSLGTNLLTIMPGSTVSSGVRGGAGSASTLTMADATGLANRTDAPAIAAVAPVVQGQTTLVSQYSNWTTTVSGSTPGWLVANARSVAVGRFLTTKDVASSAQVMVLGAVTAQELQVGPGSSVTLNGVPFTVIGILTPIGSQGFANLDDLAVIPITTAQNDFFGPVVQRIMLSATSQATIGSAYQEADQLLLQTHHISDPANANFQITTPTQLFSTAQAITGTLTILLASVAAIALLVGGIGVMNIMLVSVTERTTEIGLRKALGATPSDLFRQFVIEAAVLTGVGGLLGVGLALTTGLIVPRLAHIPMDITLPPIIIAVTVSVFVGIVFGVYPASRAARLAPIDALHYQ